MILRDIGHQSDSQLSFISSKHAISYVKDLEAKSQESRVNEEPALVSHGKALTQSISRDHRDLVKVLFNLLNFNPYFRMTALECLQECRIFDSVRDKKKEAGLLILKEASKERTLINL